MRRRRRNPAWRLAVGGIVLLALGGLVGLALSFLTPVRPPASPPPPPKREPVVKAAPRPPQDPAPFLNAEEEDAKAKAPETPMAALPETAPPVSASPPAPSPSKPSAVEAKAPSKPQPQAASPPRASEAKRERFAYTLHVESFQGERTAQKRVQSLQKAGLDAFSREVNLPGKGKYYRVFVGRFPNRPEALAAAENLRGKHTLPGARVVATSEMER